MGNKPDKEPWWLSEEPHRLIADAIRGLDQEQNYRSELNRRHLRFYSARMAAGLKGDDWSSTDDDGRLRLNVVKAVVNTAVAWIATNKVRSMFLTEKGNREQRERGKKLGQFVVGLRKHLGLHNTGMLVFRDGGIFGDGFIKVMPTYKYGAGGKRLDGDIIAERVLCEDLIVDDVESTHGNPRNIIQHAEVDPECVIDEFGKKFKDEVHDSVRIRESLVPHSGRAISPVSLMEAFHLGGENDPGRHVLCTDKVTIIDEPWGSRFPYARWGWDPPIRGYFAIGIAEELASIQREINYLLKKIQTLMTLATSQVWVEKGSGVNLARISNADFAAREYKGRPPIFMAVQAVSPEYFAQLDRLWERAFEVIGVSQMSATGEKPKGLSTGTAVRNYRDITTRRFLHVQQRWEDFNVDEVDDRLVDAARQIAKETGRYKMLTSTGKYVEDLDFKKVDLDRDKYIMQAHPVSFLPDEPAGQMQTLKEFGDISPEIQKQLITSLTYPDLEDAVARANGAQRLCDLLIQRMLDDGEARVPDAFIDPAVSIPMFRAAIMDAEIDGVPDERIQLLRDFVVETQRLWAPPTPPAAGAMPAGPGTLPALGQPPPAMPPQMPVAPMPPPGAAQAPAGAPSGSPPAIQ